MMINDLPYSKAKMLRRPHEGEEQADREPEARLQELCEQYLDARGITYLHIPAAAYQGRAAHALAGWPDLMIFQPDGFYNSVLCVELKSKRGKVRTAQARKARHIEMYVVRSFDYFQKVVNKFMEVR